MEVVLLGKINVKKLALALLLFYFAKDGKHGLSENCSSVHFMSIYLVTHCRHSNTDNERILCRQGMLFVQPETEAK